MIAWLCTLKVLIIIFRQSTSHVLVCQRPQTQYSFQMIYLEKVHTFFGAVDSSSLQSSSTASWARRKLAFFWATRSFLCARVSLARFHLQHNIHQSIKRNISSAHSRVVDGNAGNNFKYYSTIISSNYSIFASHLRSYGKIKNSTLSFL